MNQMDIQPLKLDDLINFITRNFADKTPQLSETVSVQEQKISEKNPQNQRLDNLFGQFSSDIKCVDVINALNNSEQNISFCSAFLTCVLEKYDTLNSDDQNICITKFFDKILCEVKKRNGLNKYVTPTLVWDKKELVHNLMEMKIVQNIIAYIVVFMNVNLFVISDDDITLFCMGKNYNIFKQNILLFFDGANYKPIFYQKEKVWYYKDKSPLKYFINQNRENIQLYQQNKNLVSIEFKIGYDGDVEFIWETKEDKKEDEKPISEKKIIVEKKEKEELPDVEKSEKPSSDLIEAIVYKQTTSDDKRKDEQYSDSEKEKSKKIDIKALDKMKCEELRQLAIKYDIKLTVKKDGKARQKLKQELIEDLKEAFGTTK